MIKADSKLEFKRIPLADLRVFEHQERYRARLLHYLDLLLIHEEDDPGFILVKPRDWGYEILDGHHRFVSLIMSGRKDALCVIIEEGEI